MPVEPPSRQVLRDIDERLAADDLIDDARKQFSAGGKTAAEQGQAGIVRPDRKSLLADNGSGIDPRFHAMHGHPELPLAVADRPLMGVEAGILRQQPGMKVQAASFEQLEHVRRNDDGAVDVDEPSARLPGDPSGLLRETTDVDDRDIMLLREFRKRVAVGILEHQCVDRRAGGFNQKIQKRACGPPLADHDETHQRCPSRSVKFAITIG